MDVQLSWKGQFFDLSVQNNDLLIDKGLETAVIISLFSDARVTEEELATPETQKRGWWGDSFPDIAADVIGSRLWTLQRSKQTEETRKKAQEYCEEALDWMLEDKLADSLTVVTEWISQGFLGIQVNIQQPKGKLTFKFKTLWNAEVSRGNS